MVRNGQNCCYGLSLGIVKILVWGYHNYSQALSKFAIENVKIVQIVIKDCQNCVEGLSKLNIGIVKSVIREYQNCG